MIKRRCYSCEAFKLIANPLGECRSGPPKFVDGAAEPTRGYWPVINKHEGCMHWHRQRTIDETPPE